LKQNTNEKQIPQPHRISATSFRGSSLPKTVSVITVEVASIIEKAESSPSVKRVIASTNVQRLGAGNVSMAVGYAMKARPILEVFAATADYIPWR